MVSTGGTLSAKLIELIGDLNESKTKANIDKSIADINQKVSKDEKNKVKLYVELFGRVDDMKADIKKIQGKVTGADWGKIKLGVELGDMNVGDINKQIGEIEKKFKEAKTGQKLQLDIEFDFKGSASRIKQEMNEIKDFIDTFKGQVGKQDLELLTGSEKGVKKSAEGIKSSVKVVENDLDKMSDSMKKEMGDMTKSSGEFSVNFKRDMTGAISGADAQIKAVDGTVNKFKYSVDETGKAFKIQSQSTKMAGDQQLILADALKKTDDAQRQLNSAVKSAPQGIKQELIDEAQAHIDASRAMIKKKEVTEEGIGAMTKFKGALSDLNNESSKMKIDKEFDALKESTKSLIAEFERLGGSKDDVARFKQEMKDMTKGSTTGMKELQDSVKTATSESVRSLQELGKEFDNINKKDFKKAIEDGDINSIKRYVEEMKGANVASLRLTEAKDKEGNAISKVKVNMEAQNGAIKSSTIEYDKATGKVYELDKSTKTLAESNKGLDGSFAGIMSRITQYFGAMQVLQKSMQAVKKTIKEILDIDAQMIELARVADPSLNLDVMLQRSVDLSKELGANVYDVVGVVGDMARTFGDFNEEQILAIARTATIMQNVSELNLEQASSTLVGTMKAFNIEAEDSIKIVNSFNEVDNNFAISTDQIAESMNRAGATAQTFGVDMEHLIGDITAVGEITQESGERIGTALRTIYSRVTTHDKSIEVLDELGISMREIGDAGPELRDVSDILGDLGEIWGDLNHEQQQNTALAIAGRNRLTQFLALMNNQAVAVEATTTAYNSQGSAMREQKQYMESYEYQMTVLGATATDVALTIGDKFVGDAMYLVITATTDVLEVLDNLIEKFGFLPIALGGATTAMLLFSGAVRGMTIVPLMESFGGLLEIGMKMGPMISGLSSKMLGFMTSAGPLASIVTGGAIVAGVMAIGWAVEKLVKRMAEAKKANEDAVYSMQEAIDMYNTEGNEVEALIDRYEELEAKRRRGTLDTESEREYLDLVNRISTMLPNAISSIDAKGQAHLKSTDAIRGEVEVLEILASANAEAMKYAYEQDLADIADKMADAQGRNKKAINASDTAMNSMNSQYETYLKAYEKSAEKSGTTEKALEREVFMRQLATGTLEEYHSSSVNATATAHEMSGIIQESSIAIGDQTVSMLSAEGSMKNTSTTAQSLIRDYASMNNAQLEGIENSDDYAEAQDKLKNNSMEFGRVVVGIYDEIAEGLDGVDAEKAIEQFDQLIGALPEEEFTKSFEVIEQNLGSLKAIIGDVASGAEIDIDSLITMLESTGMESDTARSYVIALGEAFENQQIRSAVAEETLTEYNDELVRTKEVALEAFNPLEALFGFDEGSLKGMESHLQMLRLMKNQYGDTWSEMDRGQDSIEALSDFFNTSTDIVVDNFELMEEITRGLSTTKVEYDKELKKDVLVFDENISGTARKFIQKMLEMGDSFPGFTNALLIEFGVIEKSQEEMATKTEEVNKRFQALFEAPNDTDAKNLLFTQIKDDLEELRGSIAFTEDDMGEFKLIMADGSRSEYLDNLNSQLEENKMSLEIFSEGDPETGITSFIGVRKGAEKTITKLGALNDLAVDGQFALDLQTQALRGLINEATTDEQRETFLDILNTQVEAFGEGIVVTGEKGKDLKLEFADGSTSPWLENMNKLVKELGYDVEIVEDGAGNFKLAIKDGEGNSIFDSEQQKVKDLNEDIDETQQKVKELAEGDVSVDIGADTTGVDEAVPHVNGQMDVIMQGDNVVMLGADAGEVDKTVDETKEKIDEIKENEVSFKMKDGDIKDFNDVIEKITGAKVEMVDVQAQLDELQRTMKVTDENMRNLMTNTENINDARNAVRKLIEDVENATSKLGELYEKFASGGIDTTGIDNASKTITDEANAIEKALIRIQDYITSMNLSIKGMDLSFDVTAITDYRNVAKENMMLISHDISALATVVETQMKNVSDAFQQGNVSLAQVQIVTSNILGQVVVLHRLTGEMITSYSLKASSDMLNNYNKGLIGILNVTTTFKGLMDNHFKQFYTSMVQKVALTANDMRSKFLEGTNGMVSIAEGLPGRIGRGVRDNMSQASSSMTALARDMVKRFKSELGIHSPSRVFTGLGGDIIDGLVNGLSGSDITNLGQDVFSDFSAGAISTINEIKGYMTFEPVTAGSFGPGFTKTSGFGPRKSPGGIGSTNHAGVDYGARMGTPIPSQSSGTVVGSGYNGSMGNYVKVRSGDGKDHIYMHQSKRNVSVGQTVGKGQILGLVGSTGNSTGPHVHYQINVNGRPINPEKKFRGFAEGGFVDKKELAWHGEEGLEAIIPLIPKRRERGLDLWEETGEKLGLNSELIRMLTGSRRGSSESGSSLGFQGLDGETASGESDTATSGTMKPDFSSIMRGMGVEHEPMFTALAKKTSKKKEEEKPEALFKRNRYLAITEFDEAMIKKAETALKALTEQSLKYRNALAMVSDKERQLLKDTEARLKAVRGRQNRVENEIQSLSNTSKHTVEQRKRYNELQQEFDNNTKAIMEMENAIVDLNVSMDERKVKIYTDYLKELSYQYDYTTGSINRTMQQAQFVLDQAELLDKTDMGKQESLRNDVLKQSIRLEKTLLNQQELLRKEYATAKKAYGSRSEQALSAREELLRVEDAYRASVLDRIKKEQEIVNIRKEVADNGIKALKNYYKQTQEMTEKAIDLERKSLEKAHKEKMDRYDEEISKINSVYDAKIQEMDDAKSADTYDKEISELSAKRAELMADISRVSRDDSLEGRKRLAELQAELTEVSKDMAETQENRQDELYRKALENQKQSQIDAVEAEKKVAEARQEAKLEELAKQEEEAKRYADSMVNNEQMWQNLADDFASGNTKELESMIEEMQETMAKYATGNFGDISMGYKSLSKEDREKFEEEALLNISNSILESNDDIKKFISASKNAFESVTAEGEKFNKPTQSSGDRPNLSTSGKPFPDKPVSVKPKPNPVKDNRYHTIKKGDNLWDLSNKYYGNPYKWNTIAQANNKLDPKKLQVGKKILIPFKTGGFTGDWAGEEGRMAVLHKKELVLNERQTSDILNVAKIVESVAGFIPKMNVAKPVTNIENQRSGGVTYVVDNLNLNVKDFKGDKKDLDSAFNNMARELKKKGRR